MKIIGIDIGKISFKAVWLNTEGQIKETFWQIHYQDIKSIWERLKDRWQITEKDQIIVTGRFRQILDYPQVVEKIAQKEGAQFLYPAQDITVIRLGGGGYSVLKINTSGLCEYKQNPPCAVGIGSFLNQILKRVDLDFLESDQKVKGIKGIELTSRCGVTMKTDFTHLLNQGNRIEEVIAGLLDSSAKSVITLALKTTISSKVLIIGGLSISNRIVTTIQRALVKHFPLTQVKVSPHALYFEALGAAIIGVKKGKYKNLPLPKKRYYEKPLEYLPGLNNYRNMVKQIGHSKTKNKSSGNLIVGLDIGSTGAKMAIIDMHGPVFETYTDTKGQPVESTKYLIKKIPPEYLSHIKAIGCTGSGREIIGNLLINSLPKENHKQIVIFNEIAAHAQGAHYYDKKVDSIVDIGGQDAKFIRLENGQVVDFCMNTVCSAGTGSFLSEQLQLLGIKDVKQFGQIALNSPRLVELGQHCAVFISEKIDDAQRKGATIEEITAGLYYSVALNYNNRVKGLRDYGQRIFLQGKPAENISLGCALAMVTGREIIVPPSPGNMGALGVAILAKKELDKRFFKQSIIKLDKFLESYVLKKREFRCRSKEGCLDGNLCSIQEITVKTTKEENKFFWGGACKKYEKVDKGSILNGAPKPFIEREKLISDLISGSSNSARTVGIPRGLTTEEILPLVITFFQELGFRVTLPEPPGLISLEHGAKICDSAFCVPIQMYAGSAKSLESNDYIFLPKIIEIEGKEKKRCYLCPLSQAVPDLFIPKISAKILQPFLSFKDGYENTLNEFVKLGLMLGCSFIRSYFTFKKAVKVQRGFEKKLIKIGRRSIRFARINSIPLIVILGRPYVVYSSLLSTEIPETIQDKGGIPLPADCYPLSDNSPVFNNTYWGYGHRLLKVAYEVRRQPGGFPLWLSVYSCGPDSFLIHFFQYLCQNKPYTVLETDAYTGHAGFKTRVEAFLYSIRNYEQPESEHPFGFKKIEIGTEDEIKDPKKKIMIPRMGEGSHIFSAWIRSQGFESMVFPPNDEESVKIGRTYTSGKECLPMRLIIGSILKHLNNCQEKNFYCFMPTSCAPCRVGHYQLLTKIILERLGLKERVKVITANAEIGYRLGNEIHEAMTAKLWSAIVFTDLLKEALLDIRPEEKTSGSSEEIFIHYLRKTEEMLLKTSNDWSELNTFWGIKEIAIEASDRFRKIKRDKAKQGKPKVLLTGEIFVRLDDFSNNNLIRELEEMGLKVKHAPFREWINYTTWQRRKRLSVIKTRRYKIYLTWLLQKTIEQKLYKIFAKSLSWGNSYTIEDILHTAMPYLRNLRPLGESALTIGLPLLLWRKKEIDGTVVVGPFECMPTRIAEAQLNSISKKNGLPLLTLYFNGESLEKDILESFVWDLKIKSY